MFSINIFKRNKISDKKQQEAFPFTLYLFALSLKIAGFCGDFELTDTEIHIRTINFLVGY